MHDDVIEKENVAIKQAYENWVNAVEAAKGNPESVLALYAADAILLPTLWPNLLQQEKQQLAAYFVQFTGKASLQVTTKALLTQQDGNIAIASGLYSFDFNDEEGQKQTLHARFNFVYRREDEQWLIINHHSSQLPE